MNCLLCGSFMRKEYEDEYHREWYWLCTVCGYDLPRE